MDHENWAHIRVKSPCHSKQKRTEEDCLACFISSSLACPLHLCCNKHYLETGCCWLLLMTILKTQVIDSLARIEIGTLYWSWECWIPLVPHLIDVLSYMQGDTERQVKGVGDRFLMSSWDCYCIHPVLGPLSFKMTLLVFSISDQGFHWDFIWALGGGKKGVSPKKTTHDPWSISDSDTPSPAPSIR